MKNEKQEKAVAVAHDSRLVFFSARRLRRNSAAVKVKIGEVTRSVFYAPEYVALSQNFFKEEGLDVELQTIPGGDKTMTALLSGAIDVALVGPETSIYVYQQGADDPVITFAQLTQRDGTFLFARKPDADFNWDKVKGSTFLGQRKGECRKWRVPLLCLTKGLMPKRISR